MLFLKYLLLITGSGLLAGAAGILAYDLYRVLAKRKEERPTDSSPFPLAPLPATSIRWHEAGRLAMMSAAPLFLGLTIAVIPPGFAAIRVSQLSGASETPLYPGVHFVLPLIQHLETFNVRDTIYSTLAAEDPKKIATGEKNNVLHVQTKEGLDVGVAISVRYRLEANKLAYVYANLPQPVEEEMVPPVVASVMRDLAPNYQGREMFSAKREEIRRIAAERISAKLGADGIQVKEVMLRDIRLPEAFAKGLEGVLLKEQESDRLTIEMDVKQKEVKTAELEAEALKVRAIKAAEAQAQTRVLEAKADAEAMQYTLPLKEKQIQQTRLEAEARKEATVKNAEAAAEAKVIDSKAELEKRKMVTEGEQDRIRRVAQADSERMQLEATVLTKNPLLIQKIIAEKLSDKVQIMMVPNDGKFFFANDVLKGATTIGQVKEP
jgi:regulator of protease activity HflC (stomatin/prohibitin superfamily)